jgi:hypothetical protein
MTLPLPYINAPVDSNLIFDPRLECLLIDISDSILLGVCKTSLITAAFTDALLALLSSQYIRICSRTVTTPIVGIQSGRAL